MCIGVYSITLKGYKTCISCILTSTMSTQTGSGNTTNKSGYVTAHVTIFLCTNFIVVSKYNLYMKKNIFFTVICVFFFSIILYTAMNVNLILS